MIRREIVTIEIAKGKGKLQNRCDGFNKWIDAGLASMKEDNH